MLKFRKLIAEKVFDFLITGFYPLIIDKPLLVKIGPKKDYLFKQIFTFTDMKPYKTA
jgi:hypothetical protein